MTKEQRWKRQRMTAHNVRPIHVHAMTDNENVDWFRYFVARESGRLGEYWKPRMRWYFWHTPPAVYQQTTPGQPYSSMQIFPTFRAACNAVREIFKEQ